MDATAAKKRLLTSRKLLVLGAIQIGCLSVLLAIIIGAGHDNYSTSKPYDAALLAIVAFGVMALLIRSGERLWTYENYEAEALADLSAHTGESE